MLRVRRSWPASRHERWAWSWLQGVMVNFSELHNIDLPARASPIRVRPQSCALQICYGLRRGLVARLPVCILCCELLTSALNTGISSRNLKRAAHGDAWFRSPLVVREIEREHESDVFIMYMKNIIPHLLLG